MDKYLTSADLVQSTSILLKSQNLCKTQFSMLGLRRFQQLSNKPKQVGGKISLKLVSDLKEWDFCAHSLSETCLETSHI